MHDNSCLELLFIVGAQLGSVDRIPCFYDGHAPLNKVQMT